LLPHLTFRQTPADYREGLSGLQQSGYGISRYLASLATKDAGIVDILPVGPGF
jgi:hypothetical protein